MQAAEAFLGSLTSGQIQYIIIPLGSDQALNSVNLTRSATHRVAHFLFGYTYMHFRQRKTIKCRLSLASLARTAKLARSTVKAALDDLEQSGLIQRLESGGNGTVFNTVKLVELFSQYAKPTGTPPRSRRKQTELTAVEDKQDARTSEKAASPIPGPEEMPTERSSDKIDDSVKQKLEKIDAEILERNREIVSLVGTGSASLRKSLQLKGEEKDRFDQINREIAQLELQRSQLLRKADKPQPPRCSGGARPVGKIVTAAANPSSPTSQQLRPKRLSNKQAQQIVKALKEMSVSNPIETLSEIIWSLNHGWLAQRPWRKEGCIAWALKAIQKGQWTTPAGFQSDQAQKLLEEALTKSAFVA